MPQPSVDRGTNPWFTAPPESCSSYSSRLLSVGIRGSESV